MLVGLAVLVVGGCDVPRRPLPQEQHLSGISYRTPLPNQCKCGFVPGVSAAYVVNQTDRPVWATVKIASYFRASGNFIASYPKNVLLPSRGSEFLECTITLNEGVSVSSATAADCAIENKFSPISEVYNDRALVKAGLTALDDEPRRGPEYCQRECKMGTPNCQPLSADYGELTGPIRSLVEEADNDGVGTVSKDAMLAAYGMTAEDDQCDRGGVDVTAKHVTNSGPGECSIRSVALASLFGRKLPMETRLSALNSSPDLTLRIPQTVRMTKAPRNLFDESARTMGTFDDLNEAFFLSFREPLLSFVGKAEIDDQNNRFAGHLRDASEITYGTNNRRAIVLSTSRGCVRFDAPGN